MDDIPVPLPDRPLRLMDQLRAFMRAKRLAYRTEKTYCLWILDFIRFHGRKHPESMGNAEVDAWLSYLANQRRVAVNTQKTALNAIVFLYKQFLNRIKRDSRACNFIKSLSLIYFKEASNSGLL